MWLSVRSCLPSLGCCPPTFPYFSLLSFSLIPSFTLFLVLHRPCLHALHPCLSFLLFLICLSFFKFIYCLSFHIRFLFSFYFFPFSAFHFAPAAFSLDSQPFLLLYLFFIFFSPFLSFYIFSFFFTLVFLTLQFYTCPCPLSSFIILFGIVLPLLLVISLPIFPFNFSLSISFFVLSFNFFFLPRTLVPCCRVKFGVWSLTFSAYQLVAGEETFCADNQNLQLLCEHTACRYSICVHVCFRMTGKRDDVCWGGLKQSGKANDGCSWKFFGERTKAVVYSNASLTTVNNRIL